jgi:hypothetical protein
MPAEQETFKAIMVMRDHHKSELCVTGDVTEPTAGWTVRLERANPQGINPRILLLNLVEQKPFGPAADVVATHHVRYDENPAMVDYAQVTIEGAFTINVTHAAHA